jgi:hypothetical protein
MHLTKNDNREKQAKHRTQEEIDQVLYSDHCIIWPKDLDTMNIGAKLFREHRNVVLDENCTISKKKLPSS